MNLPPFFRSVLPWAALLCPTAIPAFADPPSPPEGFRAIFNGLDINGWYGLNPHSTAKLEGEKKEQDLAQQRAGFPQHWTVENGELVNDGHGPYATTSEEFGDIDLLIDYKTVPKADSGVYLRGVPQIQIWDWNQPFDHAKPTRRPHFGSGGLFNNTPGNPGRDPLVLADRPFGEWNQLRIRQIGALTWVWLNDQLVVEASPMENYWDRSAPFPSQGPLMLQTHGGEIRWRNLFVRDISPAEARDLLAAHESTLSSARAALTPSLTFFASFDDALDADFSRGGTACHQRSGQQWVPAAPTEDVRIAPDAGRFGGALHFTRKNNFRPAYPGEGFLGYNTADWNASVSVWIRVDPNKDLEPGYCDPIQIVGEDTKKGFIFLEWSKDEIPRFFRYAIRPILELWNPDNVHWEEIAAAKRPMVQIAGAPFSSDSWTHAVFTLEHLNHPEKPSSGTLYLNGARQGTIENWNLKTGWDPAQVALVLGASYVGHLDDLAVFNRPLSPEEVRLIFGLRHGIRELLPQ